jgi:hypothetical protein
MSRDMRSELDFVSLCTLRKPKLIFFLCSLENYHSTYWFGSLCVCVCVWWGGVDMSTPLLAKFSVGRATSYHQILPTDAHHYQVFP